MKDALYCCKDSSSWWQVHCGSCSEQKRPFFLAKLMHCLCSANQKSVSKNVSCLLLGESLSVRRKILRHRLILKTSLSACPLCYGRKCTATTVLVQMCGSLVVKSANFIIIITKDTGLNKEKALPSQNTKLEKTKN